MNKTAKILIFIILLVLVMPGCSSNLAKKVLSTQKRAENYPQTADKVAKAFTKAIIKENFKEAVKYTHELNFNGANFNIIKKEIVNYSVSSYGGRNNSDQQIKIYTKDPIGIRQLSIKKFDGKWKIIETYVEYDDYFKSFATFIWYIESRNKEVLQRNYGLHNNDTTTLLTFFKHNKPLFTYPKLESIYQKKFDHKIYKKGTSEGIIFHFTKDPNSKSWDWTLGKEFRE